MMLFPLDYFSPISFKFSSHSFLPLFLTHSPSPCSTLLSYALLLHCYRNTSSWIFLLETAQKECGLGTSTLALKCYAEICSTDMQRSLQLLSYQTGLHAQWDALDCILALHCSECLRNWTKRQYTVKRFFRRGTSREGWILNRKRRL